MLTNAAKSCLVAGQTIAGDVLGMLVFGVTALLALCLIAIAVFHEWMARLARLLGLAARLVFEAVQWTCGRFRRHALKPQRARERGSRSGTRPKVRSQGMALLQWVTSVREDM